MSRKKGLIDLSGQGLDVIRDWQLKEVIEFDTTEEPKRLQLNNNSLSAIPNWLPSLFTAALQEIYLDQNKLTSLPAEFSSLKIQVLILNQNEFSVFPPVVSKMPNLKRLEMDDNKLKYIPDDVKNLIDLNHLSLKNNCLVRISPSLSRLPIKYLNVEGNHLFAPPQSIIQKSMTAGFAWMQNLERGLASRDRVGEVYRFRGNKVLDDQLNAAEDIVPKTSSAPILWKKVSLADDLFQSVAELGNFRQCMYLEIAGAESRSIGGSLDDAFRVIKLKTPSNNALLLECPDVPYVAVFGGYQGREVSQWLRQNLHKLIAQQWLKLLEGECDVVNLMEMLSPRSARAAKESGQTPDLTSPRGTPQPLPKSLPSLSGELETTPLPLKPSKLAIKSPLVARSSPNSAGPARSAQNSAASTSKQAPSRPGFKKQNTVPRKESIPWYMSSIESKTVQASLGANSKEENRKSVTFKDFEIPSKSVPKIQGDLFVHPFDAPAVEEPKTDVFFESEESGNMRPPSFLSNSLTDFVLNVKPLDAFESEEDFLPLLKQVERKLEVKPKRKYDIPDLTSEKSTKDSKYPLLNTAENESFDQPKSSPIAIPQSSNSGSAGSTGTSGSSFSNNNNNNNNNATLKNSSVDQIAAPGIAVHNKISPSNLNSPKQYSTSVQEPKRKAPREEFSFSKPSFMEDPLDDFNKKSLPIVKQVLPPTTLPVLPTEALPALPKAKNPRNMPVYEDAGEFPFAPPPPPPPPSPPPVILGDSDDSSVPSEQPSFSPSIPETGSSIPPSISTLTSSAFAMSPPSSPTWKSIKTRSNESAIPKFGARVGSCSALHRRAQGDRNEPFRATHLSGLKIAEVATEQKNETESSLQNDRFVEKPPQSDRDSNDSVHWLAGHVSSEEYTIESSSSDSDSEKVFFGLSSDDESYPAEKKLGDKVVEDVENKLDSDEENKILLIHEKERLRRMSNTPWGAPEPDSFTLEEPASFPSKIKDLPAPILIRSLSNEKLRGFLPPPQPEVCSVDSTREDVMNLFRCGKTSLRVSKPGRDIWAFRNISEKCMKESRPLSKVSPVESPQIGTRHSQLTVSEEQRIAIKLAEKQKRKQEALQREEERKKKLEQEAQRRLEMEQKRRAQLEELKALEHKRRTGINEDVANKEAIAFRLLALAITRGFEAADDKILNVEMNETMSPDEGSSAAIAMFMHNRMMVAHCGNVDVLLFRNDEILRLTRYHVPNLPEEHQRIDKLGGVGTVQFDKKINQYVIRGKQTITRAFGLREWKIPLRYLVSEPDLTEIALIPEDRCVVMATGGCFSSVDDSKLMEITNKCLSSKEAAHKLSELAKKMNQSGCCTVINLKWDVEIL